MKLLRPGAQVDATRIFYTGLGEPGGLENVRAESGSVASGEGPHVVMPAQADGLPEGFDELLAIGTGAQVSADLVAQGTGQLVVHVRRQSPEDLETLGLRMPMALAADLLWSFDRLA
jgi:hypothetical protein